MIEFGHVLNKVGKVMIEYGQVMIEFRKIMIEFWQVMVKTWKSAQLWKPGIFSKTLEKSQNTLDNLLIVIMRCCILINHSVLSYLY